MISLNSSNPSWIPPLTYRWIEAEGEIDCTIFFDIKNVQQAQAMISCRGKRSFYPVEWTFPLISKEKVCQFLLKQHQEPYFQIRVERQGEQFKIYLDCQKLSQKADKIIQKLNVEIFTANSMRVSLFVDWYNEREDKEERKRFLLDTILSTPTKPHNKVVAANSATILNQGRYSFSRLNLQGIQIPYANLPRVILEGADLRGADLRHTSLVNGCLTNADLRKCRMEGIDFRLKPHLEVDVAILALALYPLNDCYLAVGGIGKHILIIDLDTRETLAKLPIDSRQSKSIGTVTSLEFSPDGKVLVAGLSDETLVTWDISYLASNNHSRPKCFRGNTLVYSVQPSSKNLINFTHVKFPSHPNYQQLLIVNRSNGMLQCLQTTNFEEIEKWRLQINAKCIYSFCFFPKIPHLLAIACNESIGIWDALSKKEIQKLCTIRDKAEVLFSPDGRFLAANTKQGIFIWETERWEQIKKFDVHSIPTISMPLHFSADSLLFAYATGNSPLYLIQTSDWQVITSLTGERKEITSVQISLKKGMVLLGNEKQIQLHILEDTTSSHQPLFQTAIRGILISPDSQFFFTLRENCLTQTNLLTLEEKIWPLKETDEGCDSTFTILPFNSPHLLEVKSKNDLGHTSYIIVHDLTEEKSTQIFEGKHLSNIGFIEKTPYITYYREEGNRLVWEVWDIHQQKAIQPLSNYVPSFSSDLDSDIFSGSDYDLIDSNWTLSPSGKYVVNIHESDHLSLLSCAKTGFLEEIGIGDIELRNEIDKPEYLQFSKDEKLFALGQQGKVEKNLRSIVRFWNLDSLKEMPSFHLPLTHKPFTSMDLSSSGKLLAISQEHSIYLWDVERSHLGEELSVGLEVKKVRFSSDTRFLLVKTAHNALYLWQLFDEQKEILTPKLLWWSSSHLESQNTKIDKKGVFSDKKENKGDKENYYLLLQHGAKEIEPTHKDLSIFIQDNWEQLFSRENYAKVQSKDPSLSSRDRQEIQAHALHYLIALDAPDSVILPFIKTRNLAQLNSRFTLHELSALHIATMKKRQAVVASLLEANVEIDSVDAYGWTPLHHAALISPEIFNLLLEKGAHSATITPLGASYADLRRLVGLEKAKSKKSILYYTNASQAKEISIDQLEKQENFTYTNEVFYPSESLRYLWAQTPIALQENEVPPQLEVFQLFGLPLSQVNLIDSIKECNPSWQKFLQDGYKRYQSIPPKLSLKEVRFNDESSQQTLELIAEENLESGNIAIEYLGKVHVLEEKEPKTVHQLFERESKNQYRLDNLLDGQECSNLARYIQDGWPNVCLQEVLNTRGLMVRSVFLVMNSIQAGQSLLWDKGCNTHFGLKWGNYHVRNKEEIRAFFRKNTLQEYYSKFSQSIDIIQQNHQKKSAFDFDYFLSTQLLRERLIYPLTTPAVLIDLTCSRIVSPNDWDILFKDANLNEAIDCWPHRWWIGRLLNILKEFHDLMTNQLNSIEGGHLFAPVICDFFLEKGSKWNVLRLVKGITIVNDCFQEFFKNSFKEPDKLHSLWNSTKKKLTKLETYDWQEDPNFCFSHVMEKWY